MGVSIRIVLAQEQSFELWCGGRSRRVEWKEVEALAATADRDYFGEGQADDGRWAPKFPQLVALGRKLFEWRTGRTGGSAADWSMERQGWRSILRGRFRRGT